jgi:hypothetical protein
MTAHRLLALLVAAHAILAGPAMAVPALSTGEPFLVMPIPADGRAQVNPVVAWDGKGTYLVVWQQGRFYHQSQSADILAVRIDARGRVLDRPPIVICNAEASQEQPRVAHSGGKFLVVWHDLRNGRDWDIYAARVTPDGRVLEPGGFLVAGGAQNQASPVLAPTGEGFLVVWQHYNRHYQLQAAKLPAVGTDAAAPVHPLRFRGEVLWGGGLALARAGSGWLLSWNDEKDWSKSGGLTTMITRRFARLIVHNGAPEVLEVQRSPAIYLGRSEGQFVGDGASNALYAGWGNTGRGGRAAAAALFEGERATALKNPNPERARGSGWSMERMIPLYDAGVLVDDQVAAAYGRGMYLTVARVAYSGKPSDRRRLLGSRLTAAGVRMDAAPWPVLHESPHSLANPVLAAGDRQFLLVFEQEDAAGRRQIWAKILKAE